MPCIRMAGADRVITKAALDQSTTKTPTPDLITEVTTLLQCLLHTGTRCPVRGGCCVCWEGIREHITDVWHRCLPATNSTYDERSRCAALEGSQRRCQKTPAGSCDAGSSCGGSVNGASSKQRPRRLKKPRGCSSDSCAVLASRAREVALAETLRRGHWCALLLWQLDRCAQTGAARVKRHAKCRAPCALV